MLCVFQKTHWQLSEGMTEQLMPRWRDQLNRRETESRTAGRWRQQEGPDRASLKGRSRETPGGQGSSEGQDLRPSPCGVITQMEGSSRPAGLGVCTHGPGWGSRPHPRLGS